MNTGKYDLSEECHKKALENAKKLLGASYVEVANSLKSLDVLLNLWQLVLEEFNLIITRTVLTIYGRVRMGEMIEAQ